VSPRKSFQKLALTGPKAVTQPKGASAEAQGDDIASTDFSDDGDDTMSVLLAPFGSFILG
jgi:hypothetical protein